MKIKTTNPMLEKPTTLISDSIVNSHHPLLKCDNGLGILKVNSLS